MDVYYPHGSESGARLPAVVFVIGYSDPGAQAILGCKFKEMESFISWAKLTAVSGAIAITYSTGKEPAADVFALLEYVRSNAADLGVDERRLGLWACSGHTPNALSVLMREGSDYLKCAVLCYGFLLDLDGSTDMVEAAGTYRFVNPCAGKSVDDLPQDTPLFIVRAGQEHFPHLNEAIERFLARAVVRNLPITFTNHPDGPHSFDLLHDSETSREIIRQILAFMRFHLAA
jgi:acetyl esterase/lipase